MSATNLVFQTGNLTRDPVLRTLRSGEQVCDFTLAVDRRRRRGDERQRRADYFYVRVPGVNGENTHRILRQGALVSVQGELQSRSWRTPDGSKGYGVRIIATDIKYLSVGGSQPDAAVAAADDGLIEDDALES